jgi:hypothetical protein
MPKFEKCIRCNFRFVTEKARESFEAEKLSGEPLLCLHCIGELTGKVMNPNSYLVYPHELDAPKRQQYIPQSSLNGCRPCMKKSGLL